MEWIPSKLKQRSSVYLLNILSWKSKPCLKIWHGSKPAPKKVINLMGF